MKASFETPILVISKCLEHDYCRYDGSMIHDPIVKRLIPYVKFMPLCPEMAIGLPSPRQALRVIERESRSALVFSLTGEDVTDAMNAYAGSEVSKLKLQPLDGFILKSRSPSCGIKDVKVYKSHGKVPMMPKKTKGFFGNEIITHFGELAIEDEGRLKNYQIRAHFYTRIFTHARFRAVAQSASMKSLVKFHSDYKYLFMAYNQSVLKQMGTLVANHQRLTIGEVLPIYEQLLNKLLSTSPQPMRNVNMMLHIFGYFSKGLSAKEKAHFLDLLERYTNHQLPQSVVMNVLWSWVVRFEEPYLSTQSIFEPYPYDLIEVADSGKEL